VNNARRASCRLARIASVHFVAAWMLIAPTSARAIEPVDSSYRIMAKQFGSDAFNIRQSGGAVFVEFCWDICDVFSWRGSVNQSAPWAFVMLYEYKVGVGQEFEPFLQNAKPEALNAAKRFGSECPQNADEYIMFDCSWKSLATRLSIRVGRAIYDEGHRCFGWIDPGSPTPGISKGRCVKYENSPWQRKK
jgi:hypothetical protein